VANVAYQNCLAQLQRGLGHHINPFGYQCSGIGYATPEDAVNGWYASAPHRAIMLNPNLNVAGLAWSGTAWTLNMTRR
jgi:hypothetical protein